MKTEQEQIEEMSCILTMLINCGGGCMAQYCHLVDNCAKKLIEAGYGDVSEYKAKIERLQSNTPQHLKDLLIEFDEMGFAPTTVCPNPGKYATKWRDRLVNCVNNATKQAQIDILNKLKERAIGYTFLGEKLATETDIDELIKEVQNETV